MCGIVGIVLVPKSSDHKKLPDLLRESLLKIQHRGYDGAGMALSTSEKIISHKNYGLITEVLTDEVLTKMKSQNQTILSGIAHTRYKTVGECSLQASQPLVNADGTLCLIHNGQIEANHRLPDSSYLLEIWDQYFQRATHNFQTPLIENLIPVILKHIFSTVQGSYSCLVLIQGYGLVAFRDPRGIRPLTIGRSIYGDYFLASEDRCFRTLGYELEEVYDLSAGSCLMIRQGIKPSISRIQIMPPNLSPCIFEYIYLAHQDSILNQLPVKEARQLLGQILANKIQKEYSDLQIDYVVPIPQTSCYASQILADQLKIPCISLLKLNPHRKRARSFILPTQQLREKAVANKFLFDENYDFKGKNLLLVDDSIVRGTTLRHLVKTIHEKYLDIGKIYVASIAPAIKNKNIYGIDIPNTELLIAYQRNLDEIREVLGVDVLIYQDLDQMLAEFTKYSGIPKFEYSMFIQS